jgi:thymidylate synthase
LSREPYPLPTLEIDDDFDLETVLENETPLDDVDKFHLKNYKHHPFIKAPMAV